MTYDRGAPVRSQETSLRGESRESVFVLSPLLGYTSIARHALYSFSRNAASVFASSPLQSHLLYTRVPRVLRSLHSSTCTVHSSVALHRVRRDLRCTSVLEKSCSPFGS